MDPAKAAVSTDHTGAPAGVLFVAANAMSVLLLLAWIIGVSIARFR
jgi:hypothetical protein